MIRPELLPWDTEHFGRQIGRADLDAPTIEDIEALDAEAEAMGLDCLYVRLGQPTFAGASVDLQSAGFRLVDVALTLSAPVRVDESRVMCSTPVESSDRLPDLDPILDVLAPWSRFAADPAFGEKAARSMYEAWIRRAADADDELLTVVEGSRGNIVGLVAVAAPAHPSIGLLAVAQPGQGLGDQLVQAGMRWAAERGERLETVTQARNGTALRFYERHGFRTLSSTYVFHRWYRRGDRTTSHG